MARTGTRNNARGGVSLSRGVMWYNYIRIGVQNVYAFPPQIAFLWYNRLIKRTARADANSRAGEQPYRRSLWLSLSHFLCIAYSALQAH